MALDKNDLKEIQKIVVEAVDVRVTKTETYLKDYVEFAIEKSERRTEVRFDKIEGRLENIAKELSDMIETDQKFLEVLGNHEQRIGRVETRLGVKGSV